MQDMQTQVIILAALAVLIVAIVLLLRGRRQRVTLNEHPAEPLERRTFAPPAKVEPKPAMVTPRPEPEVAAALAGGRATPLAAPVEDGDSLTTIKGLGPKAAAQLNALGITRFADLAALDDDGVTALDARMGNFKGRIRRDQWVEQARLLAEGDRTAFEAKFGKIG